MRFDEDDQFWQVVRLLFDTRSKITRHAVTNKDVIDALKAAKGPAAQVAIQQIERRQLPVAEYLKQRREWVDDAVGKLRTESEAKLDLLERFGISPETYKTSNQSHHQSSKILVPAVSGAVKRGCELYGIEYLAPSEKRSVIVEGNRFMVTPRNVDGTFPMQGDARAIWEVKEYWGKTKGGSKMSDAVYEVALVGHELRRFEKTSGRRVRHYAILDGKDQWKCRLSDLGRFSDLLAMGLVDDVLIGSDVVNRWPEIVKEFCQEYKNRK